MVRTSMCPAIRQNKTKICLYWRFKLVRSALNAYLLVSAQIRHSTQFGVSRNIAGRPKHIFHSSTFSTLEETRSRPGLSKSFRNPPRKNPAMCTRSQAQFVIIFDEKNKKEIPWSVDTSEEKLKDIDYCSSKCRTAKRPCYSSSEKTFLWALLY